MEICQKYLSMKRYQNRNLATAVTKTRWRFTKNRKHPWFSHARKVVYFLEPWKLLIAIFHQHERYRNGNSKSVATFPSDSSPNIGFEIRNVMNVGEECGRYRGYPIELHGIVQFALTHQIVSHSSETSFVNMDSSNSVNFWKKRQYSKTSITSSSKFECRSNIEVFQFPFF
jgi:hypothetical protein